ncbi:MAG: colanic acid biosynthesis protein [candidate division BRC1 bacterium ADurb.BinA364]|nr:MAG: colanic acid biosynthesis protein [candidate division BRC1 bacterium ADurb.BinA364]
MSHRAFNILISGAGFENKGAEAMLRTVQQQLARRIPDSTFWLEPSRVRQSVAFQYGYDMPYSPESAIRRSAKLLRSLIRNPGLLPLLRFEKIAWSLSQLPALNAFIDISGFSFSDEWGVERARKRSIYSAYFSRNRAPVFFLPQAWGPFDNPKVAHFTRRAISQARLACPRDPQSLAYVEGLVGKSRDNVLLCPDIAFLFEGAAPDVGRALLAGLGLAGERRPLVGIVPNLRVYERAEGKGLANAYLRALGAVARRFIENLGARLVLAPNDESVPGAPVLDDRYLCSLLELLIDDKANCRVVRDYWPAENFKALWGQVDFLLSSRFHGLVFALSQGVPVAAIGWSHKYVELLKPFGLSEFVFDHGKLDSDAIWAALEQAWNRRSESRAAIQERLPAIRSSVERLFDLVAEKIVRAEAKRAS